MKYIIILILLLFTSCYAQESLKEAIIIANHCKTADDCVSIGSKCPFGCNVLVNKVEAQKLQQQINSYPTIRCDQQCVIVKEVVCEENKCKNIIE